MVLTTSPVFAGSCSTATTPVERMLDGALSVFSAPGEGRESVEIARRILQEARRGVRFDEMATSFDRHRATSVCSSTP